MLTYRIWDKTTPINGCPANKAMESLRIQPTDVVYIIVNDQGRDWIIQTQSNCPYPGATLEESAENHIAQLIAEQDTAQSVTPEQ